MYHMLRMQYADTYGGIVNTIPFSFYIYRSQPSYYIRPDYLNKPLNFTKSIVKRYWVYFPVDATYKTLYIISHRISNLD